MSSHAPRRAPEPTAHGTTSAEIGLCLMLAAADGQVSEREIGALSTRLGQLLGDDVTILELQAVVEGEIQALDELGPDAYLETLVARIPEERRSAALRAAARVAFADGVTTDEEASLREAGAALGVADLEVEALLKAR
jgi:uncharacterized tellurite resistance protein B-like protein